MALREGDNASPTVINIGPPPVNQRIGLLPLLTHHQTYKRFQEGLKGEWEEGIVYPSICCSSAFRPVVIEFW